MQGFGFHRHCPSFTTINQTHFWRRLSSINARVMHLSQNSDFSSNLLSYSSHKGMIWSSSRWQPRIYIISFTNSTTSTQLQTTLTFLTCFPHEIIYCCHIFTYTALLSYNDTYNIYCSKLSYNTTFLCEPTYHTMCHRTVTTSYLTANYTWTVDSTIVQLTSPNIALAVFTSTSRPLPQTFNLCNLCVEYSSFSVIRTK